MLDDDTEKDLLRGDCGDSHTAGVSLKLWFFMCSSRAKLALSTIECSNTLSISSSASKLLPTVSYESYDLRFNLSWSSLYCGTKLIA